MTTETLEAITRAEQQGAEAAAKAQREAEAAKLEADRARERAERERARAYRAYLDQVTAEWPGAHEAATTALGKSRTALEEAVQSGDGVFAAYLRWVESSVRAWEVDSELARIRHHHGVPVRSTDPPTFRFDTDISAIIDQIAFEFQDEAVVRIDDRRTAFVSGRTA